MMSAGKSGLRLFLAEDSAIVRDGLRSLISALDTVEVCGEADSVPKAVAGISATRADAVILDVDLRDGKGIDVLRAVKAHDRPPVVIVLTIHPFEEMGRHYMHAGADYYFEKGSSVEVLLSLLERLAARPELTSPAETESDDATE